MPRPTPPSSAPDTQQRLLAAAAEVFLAHGFEGASTRAICERAEANIAAISYHFGSKEELFRAVLRLPLERLERSIAEFSDPALDLAAALRALFAAMLAPLRPGGPEAAAMRLVVRSFAAPDRPRGGGPDLAVIRRHHAALGALLGRHLPAACPEPARAILAGALVGMAMHAVHAGMEGADLPQVLGAAPDDAAVDALAARLADYGCALVALEAGRAGARP
ncbi:MAG: TetR/AcrR family transcriptional regulator [Planctomycetes bacterium]|nr:TetR/AcrR family transcriptional regulator [Planctomycetota bacterium]